MKKVLLILLISLFPRMLYSSIDTFPKIVQDSLIVITPIQLKQTNLIFLEHKKLKLENYELQNSIVLYKDLLSYSSKMDSTKTQKINLLIEENKKCFETINKNKEQLNKLSTKNKILLGCSIGGITLSAALLTVLLIK